VNLVNVIPGGVVAFFPSYDYEDLVYRHLGREELI
jgi:Rad3-related DNA helicase